MERAAACCSAVCSGLCLLALSIVIRVPPATPTDGQAALLESCNGALGPRQCELDPVSGSGSWTAVVQDAPNGAKLELRNANGDLERRRQLLFDPGSSVRERWASVGVLIAALVIEEQTLEEPPSRVEPTRRVATAPAKKPEPRPHMTVTTHRQPVSMLVGARTGTGLSLARPAFGVFLSGYVSVVERWPELVLSTSYSRADGAVDLRLMSFSIGAAYRFSNVLPRLSLVPRLSANTVRVTATARDGSSSDTASSQCWGGRGAAELWWQFMSPLSLVIGGELDVVDRDVRVRVHDREVGHVPSFRWGAIAGLAWSP